MTTPASPPPTGTPEIIAKGVVRILAPNPSPMTYWGTNSYILGDDVVVVIDPGPIDPAHLTALRQAIGKRTISHILVTHSHLDHSPLAAPLSRLTGAPVCAFGPSHAGRSAVMATLAQDGLLGGGEGIDAEFYPDITLDDGAVLNGPWGEIAAIHTPGHIGNHLSFHWQDMIFSGDHVMGWASSLVSPPDGDLRDFLASCRKLQGRGARHFAPGHGPTIDAPEDRLHWLISHREGRSAALLQALDAGPADPATLTRMVYTDTPAALLQAAERNVLAHLIALTELGEIAPLDRLHAGAVFAKSDRA